MSPETTETKEADINIDVQPSAKNVAYKTKVVFLDGSKKDIISVAPPQVQQTGLIQFILEDRVIVIPIGVVKFSETEQIKALEPSKIIISSK